VVAVQSLLAFPTVVVGLVLGALLAAFIGWAVGP